MWMAILKPEITWKHSEKRKKTTYWKPNETKYQNTSLVGVQFLHLACQGSGSHPSPSGVASPEILGGPKRLILGE